MTNVVAYLTRVMVIRQMGLDAAGLYQAAFALSSVYVGFVLGAMGADYYPRLTAVSADNKKVNRLVNEQTEVSLLLALPGILGTLTFATWVIHLLYSAQFEPAVDILRWQILGVLGRVVSWPVGFVLLAKGRGKTFFYTELAANIVNLCLIWLGMKWFGLSGLGMAFFAVYAFYLLMILSVVHRLCGFIWTKANLRLVVGSSLATAAVFLGTADGLHTGWSMVIGGGLTAGTAFYATRKMARRAGCIRLTDAWSQNPDVFEKESKMSMKAALAARIEENDRPLISFCLFAYNQERFIRKAVEGALSQTYSPLEIVLSDDCSTDSTFEIIKEMTDCYHGLHSIVLNRNPKNLGVGGHVNRVMEIAQGILVVAAAGDDNIPTRKGRKRYTTNG